MESKRGLPLHDEALRDVTHVFLDVGGTILHPEPGTSEVFRTVLGRRGHLPDRETIQRVVRSPDRIVSLIRPLARDRQDGFYRHLNARVVEHLGFGSDEPLLDELDESFAAVVWRPYPETLVALETLRRTVYHLGVISNASHRLPQMLAECRVLDFFETVTYSSEVGAEKPDPRIFRRAIAQAGTSPERAVHVGDSYEADYLGARNAGLHAFVLMREGEPPAPCPRIRSLDALAALLGTSRSRP